MAVAPAPTSGWLQQDATYNAQLAALMRALQNREAGFVQQRSAYDTDFNQGLHDLGWNPGVGGAPGQWNMTDRLTTSGKANQSQLGDFASRGMLQSSGYGEAKDNLNRSLNMSLTDAERQRQNFLDSSQLDETTFKDQNLLQQQQAKADALARRAAQYGVR